MTKQEIYSWSATVSSLVLLAFYLIGMLGWPTSLESHSDYISDLLWKVLLVAIAVEVALELFAYFNIGEVDEDERDERIKSKGYRNAYYVVMVSLVWLVVSLFLSDVMSKSVEEEVFLAVPFMTLHALVIILFVAHITKYVTQIFYYQKQ